MVKWWRRRYVMSRSIGRPKRLRLRHRAPSRPLPDPRNALKAFCLPIRSSNVWSFAAAKARRDSGRSSAD